MGMRLNYAHNAFHPQHTHQNPTQPVREGFTRNTGDDVVAICPSCGRELAYDPDESPGDTVNTTTTNKAPRTKRDKAEHHFFAVKACGHVSPITSPRVASSRPWCANHVLPQVYCKMCYENRKPSSRNPVVVGFRSDPNTNKGKVLCAVDGCESDVGTKTSWVGIFI